MIETTATSVYRYYDEHDVMIYVGITSRGMKRNTEHYRSKTWWPYVVRQEVEHFGTREEAASRETALIKLHTPPYNTQQNADAAHLRRTYEAIRAKLPDGIDPIDLARSLGRSLPLVDVTAASGPVRFVTAAEHVPITARLGMSGTVRVVRGSEVVGRVQQMERRGPFVFLAASVRHGIDRTSAVADLRILTGKDGTTFGLHRIRIHDTLSRSCALLDKALDSGV